MTKVTFNIHRTTIYRVGASLRQGDYFQYVSTEHKRIDGSLTSGILLCVKDGKECVDLYTGEVVNIYADQPVELAKNIKIEGDI